MAAGLARANDIEHHNLILTFAQPAAGHIKRLLRADFPYTTEGMAVDIDKSFAPCGEIEEGVRRFVDLERAAVDSARQSAVVAGRESLYRQEFSDSGICVELIFDIVDFPTGEAASEVVLAAALGDSHIVGDTLEVFDGAAEVDTSHSLDQYIELRTLGHGGQRQVFLTETAVKLAYELAVDKYLSIVVGVVDGELAAGSESRKCGAVKYRAEALVIFLHGLYLAVLFRLGQIGEERSHLCKGKLRHGYRLYRRRYGRHFLSLIILGEGIAQGVIFWCELTRLRYRGVVVVACHVRSESG